MISTSYDGGKSWQMRSFFSYYQSLTSDKTSFLGKDRAYILNLSSFYTTSDGGVTWLPQKYMPDYPQVANNTPGSYFFNNNGNGFVRILTRNNSDTNVLATSDFGKTYIRVVVAS